VPSSFQNDAVSEMYIVVSGTLQQSVIADVGPNAGSELIFNSVSKVRAYAARPVLLCDYVQTLRPALA
jgi:hypothetical protein